MSTEQANSVKGAICGLALLLLGSNATAAEPQVMLLKDLPIPVQAYVLEEMVKLGVEDPINKAKVAKKLQLEFEITPDGRPDYAVQLCDISVEGSIGYCPNGFLYASGGALIVSNERGYDFIAIDGQFRAAKPGNKPLVVIEERVFAEIDKRDIRGCKGEYACNFVYGLDDDPDNYEQKHLELLQVCPPFTCEQFPNPLTIEEPKQTPRKSVSEATSKLCRLALFENGTWDWRPQYQAFVAEAKRKGLSVQNCQAALNSASGSSDVHEVSFAETNTPAENVASRYYLCAAGDQEAFAAERKRQGISDEDCRKELGIPPVSAAEDPPKKASLRLPVSLGVSGRNKAALWRALMDSQYGNRDAARHCWKAQTLWDNEPEYLCMRPLRMDEKRAKDGARILFMIASSIPEDEMGCQMCPGAVGLFKVLTWHGQAKLIAAMPLVRLGSWETAPAAEDFRIIDFGRGNWGWSVKLGYMHVGELTESLVLIGGLSSVLKELGTLPMHYDDLGNCEKGKRISSGEPCSSYDFSFGFDRSSQSTFQPIILQASGKRRGTAYSDRLMLPFDDVKGEYPSPDPEG